MQNKIRHLLTLLTAILILAPQAFSQTLKVQAPSEVEAGSTFSVAIQINDNVGNIPAPSITGGNIAGGPSTSRSSSMTFINGHRESSTTTTFTYWVTAGKEGTLTIGSVKVNNASSSPVQVRVVKPDPAAQQARQQQQQQQQQRRQQQANDPFAIFDEIFGDPRQQRQRPQPAQVGENDIFIVAQASKSNPYKGEQVAVNYRLFTRVGVNGLSDFQMPTFKGFWAEDVTPDKNTWSHTTYNGNPYDVTDLKREILFPQEDGTLNIAPMQCKAQVVTGRSFFGASVAERTLKSNALNIKVRPLPEAPEHFCGGVGSFKATGAIDHTETRANEAITYRITVNGTGNLPLVEAPDIAFGTAFEAYTPQTKDKISHNTGSRTFEWVLIPRSQGEYQIPAVDIAFFNPQSGKYETSHIDAIDIKVEKGDSEAMTNASTSKSDVTVLNHDINHISPKQPRWEVLGSWRQTPWWFWVALGVIALTALVTILLGRRHHTMEQDVAGTRLRRATKEARKRLRQAAKHLHGGNDNLFYEEIYRAIWGVLADKYNIPLANLSSDTVREMLAAKEVPQEQQEHILQTLNHVDYARFAPQDGNDIKQQIYDEALQMIATL